MMTNAQAAMIAAGAWSGYQYRTPAGALEAAERFLEWLEKQDEPEISEAYTDTTESE